MIIYFIRHGQTVWNKEKKFQGVKDSPLTELGISQTKKLKENLKNIKFTHFYSSPLGRARETLSILTENRTNPKIKIIDELKEINLGDMEGVSREYFAKKHPIQFYNLWKNGKNYNPTSFNGETLQSVFERGIKVIKTLTKNHSPEDLLLVVSHGILLEAIFAFLKKEDIDYFGEKNVPENTSYTIIEYKNGSFKILDFSNVSHLN